MRNLTETGLFPLETWGLYSTALVHSFFRPCSNSAGSEVAHRPTTAEINEGREAAMHWLAWEEGVQLFSSVVNVIERGLIPAASTQVLKSCLTEWMLKWYAKCRVIWVCDILMSMLTGILKLIPLWYWSMQEKGLAILIVNSIAADGLATQEAGTSSAAMVLAAAYPD